jgi:hemin uptake protein HemP
MTDTSPQNSDHGQMPIHNVDGLLGRDGRAGLMLNGVLYILRVTKTGKLILTK